jgi:hypothetical protein
MWGLKSAGVGWLGGCFLLTLLSAGNLRAQSFPADSHPPTLEAARSLLQAVCSDGGMVKANGQGVEAGCKSCPSIVPGGSDFDVPGSDTPNFSLKSVIYGSFTRTGASEAVAGFSGCEPHSDNYGGSVLLEKAPTGWKAKSYQPAFISNRCLKYPLKSGRDMLLCEAGDSVQGAVYARLFTFDYAQPEQHRDETLISTTDTVNTCMPGDHTVGSIEQVQLRDLNHDGMADLVVSIKAARVQIREGQEENCPDKLGLPPVKVQELDFLFTGETFKIAPWSAQAKQAMEALFAGK